MDLSSYLFKLRDNLARIGIDHLDDAVAHMYLNDAYEYIQMLGETLGVEITTLSESHVKICTIKLATYFTYKNYNKLAEQRIDGAPEAMPLQVTYDSIDARSCLSLLFKVKINEELLPEIFNYNFSPVMGGVGPSIVDMQNKYL